MPEPLAQAKNLSGSEEDPVAVLVVRADHRLDGMIAQFIAQGASLGLEGNWHPDDSGHAVAKVW